MKAEVLDALTLDPSVRVVVDGTLGGGGHAAAIRDRLPPEAVFVGCDRDPAAVRRVAAAWGDLDGRTHLVPASYAALPDTLTSLSLPLADRVLLDLGLSSDQLVDRSRGFGFDAGGSLDLRFDPTSGLPASRWLADTPVSEIAKALRTFADEPNADRIAAALSASPPETTEELVELVRPLVSAAESKHPATRTIQALRIGVNDELGHLQRALTQTLPRAVCDGGIVAILTFHSIEDRIVKQAFRETLDPATGKPIWTPQGKKPILPRPAEVRANPRTRSAKLRIAVRNG